MVESFKPNKGNASSEWEWEWKLSSNNNYYGTRNKRKKAAMKERNNTGVSMYVTNFPLHMDSQDLRIMCGQVGTVADVYLPRNKLSKSGKRFAFVRFLQEGASELARKLSAIWIGNYHLFATLARHDQKKPFYQSQKIRKEGRNLNNNQPYGNIRVKGMKQIILDFQDMVKEEDRFSALPDCLLLEILSRLDSTKDAIRTGTLSNRWKHLWTLVHTLIFKHKPAKNPVSDFVSFVDKALTQCRQLKLKQFRVEVCDYDFQYESQVNNWIRYAIRCNVEELYVFLWNDKACLLDFTVDQSFFICSCFTDLRVAGCKLNPVGTISWKNLKSLYITDESLDDDFYENIFSGSPLLETLALSYSYNVDTYRRLSIISKIFKNLVFSGPVIEIINAPNNISLTIQNYQRFYRPLLVDMSSLAQANLDYMMLMHYQTHEEEEEGEEYHNEFMLKLLNVNEPMIGGFISAEVASSLEAKGFVFPSDTKVVKSSWFFW